MPITTETWYLLKSLTFYSLIYLKNDISYSKEESKENENSRIEDVHEVQPQHAAGHGGHGGHGEEGFGDIFVHQLIETIEFVLG